jgi:hypothetical protein
LGELILIAALAEVCSADADHEASPDREILESLSVEERSGFVAEVCAAIKMRRAKTVNRLVTTFCVPWEEPPLWEQLSLFGPPAPEHEMPVSIQFDLDGGTWNASAVTTAALLDRFR